MATHPAPMRWGGELAARLQLQVEPFAKNKEDYRRFG